MKRVLLTGMSGTGKSAVIRELAARGHTAVDHVVLLRAPALVMLARLASRTDNPYGKRPEEVAAVLANLREVEPRLRAVAGHEVDPEASRTTCRRLGQAWRSSRPRSSSAGSASTGPQACIPPLICR